MSSQCGGRTRRDGDDFGDKSTMYVLQRSG